jgi:hypothetical protein
MHKLRSIKLFPILFFYALYILSGCTHIPSTNAVQIAKSENTLYIGTNIASRSTTAFIRLYDIDKNQWGGKIVLSNVKETVIEKMLTDNNDLYVQQKGNWKENGGIYSISKKGDINRIVELTHSESLVGMDDDYFYLVERKDINNIAKNGRFEYIFRGTKYSRQSNVRAEFHFEQNHDVVVWDVWEDDQSYWYACLLEEKPRDHNVPEGKLVLVNKSKHGNKIDIYKYDSNNWVFGAQLFGDKDWIWIFPDTRDHNVSIKFSKKDKTFDLNNAKLKYLRPFSSIEHDENDNYLWFYKRDSSTGEVKVYRVDKETLTPTQIDLPKGLRSRYTFYEDKNFLWVDVYKLTSYAPTGNTVPYLLKISKNDLSYNLILVKPTVGDSIKTILYNFFFWFWIPFFRG